MGLVSERGDGAAREGAGTLVEENVEMNSRIKEGSCEIEGSEAVMHEEDT